MWCLHRSLRSIRVDHLHENSRCVLLSRLARSVSKQAQPYVSHEVHEQRHVPLPLCRRQASHVELLAALMEWKTTVLDEINSIKDAFETADGGPSTSELQREVTWVLDDVVAAWREQEQQQWQPCSWQQLGLEQQAAARRSRSTADWQVQLRAPVQQLQQLWQLRLQDRVPFQYLIHTAHWRDLVLSVGPGILVPRPETEIMIDLAAAAITANPALAAAPWADLGTGSGAIAIGTAQLLQKLQKQQVKVIEAQQQPLQLPQEQQHGQSDSAAVLARVWAVDLSSTALAYTAANAAAYGVQGFLQVAQGSWFEPLKQLQLQGKLGGVLSNPPYIPRVQMAELQAEVGQHEPWSALDGGPDAGIDSLQVICSGAVEMLMPGGFLALETAGREQAYLVQQMLQQLVAGSPQAPVFMDVQVHNDCYGVPRFVSAIRCSS